MKFSQMQRTVLIATMMLTVSSGLDAQDGVQLMHLNNLLAFDGIIASRGGIPLINEGKIIGAIGSSGGTDSQDEVVSEAGAAVIRKLPASTK